MTNQVVHLVSVSGGKDSTATYCKAVERGFSFRAVAADTGNEHPLTYEAIDRLSRVTGGPKVELVKADFAAKIIAKRAYVEKHWRTDLMKGKSGRWVWRPQRRRGKPLPPPPHSPEIPPDIYDGRARAVQHAEGIWVWQQGYKPLTAEQAEEAVAVALVWLQPTGVPFFDMCIWKGRFPSRKAQFCTFELKVNPIDTFVTRPILATGANVISWQGVRAAESEVRRYLKPFQRLNSHPDLPGKLVVYRPLLRVESVDEVFAIAERHGLQRNPLYDWGLKRVGCFPCINCSKDELALVDTLFPEQVDRLEEWEARVSMCSKRGMSTFFNIVNDPVMQEEWTASELLGERLVLSHQTHGIRRMVEWAKTDRGGRQYSLLARDTSTVCNEWGACE